MPIAVFVAAAAVTAAVPLLWWGVASGRGAARGVVAQNLTRGLGATDLREAVLARGMADRALRPAAKALAGRSRALTPAGWTAALERRITLAGRPASWPLERVLSVKLLLGIVGGAAGLVALAGSPSTTRVLLTVGAAATGFFVPDIVLARRAAERQKAIQLALPDTLDQMTICVEAGLGFEAAMARAAQGGDGPLPAELVRTLQEMQIGVKRAVALRNLADRTTVRDLRRFTLAVIQAESYGVAVADVLRVQAAELRVRRRQNAEKRAMKIPVQIIFPVILCILPAIFTVVLGPAAIRIIRTMFTEGGFLG